MSTCVIKQDVRTRTTIAADFSSIAGQLQ